MKKVLSLCVAAILVIAAALPVSAERAVGNLTPATISADPERTVQITVSDPVWLDRLGALLEKAEATAESVGYTEIARIALEPDKSEIIFCERNTDGLALLRDKAFAVDRDGMYALLAALDGFYRYRAIPAATIAAGQEPCSIPPSESSYAYCRLEGVYYRIRLVETPEPPSVAVDGRYIPMPVFSVPAAAATVRISHNGSEVFTGNIGAAAAWTAQPADTYTVSVTATFESDYYYGNVTYSYDVRTGTGQGPGFSVEGGGTVPGEVVVLRVGNIAPGTEITFRSDIPFTPTFFDGAAGERLALLPVSYFVAPGEHYVQLTADGVTERFGITVNHKDFQVQHLTVSEQTAEETIHSQKANDEYNRVITPLRSVADAAPHWEGRFILPVTGGRISTEFGAIRYTNGSAASSRHGAVDIALPTGTHVVAPNFGRVLYAGYLQLTGNTILIEHGYGLKTWYYHMDSLAVKTGSMVAKGQKIGEVGSTGFSTGPHLHFGMSVNNVFINPYTAIETDLLNLDNA